MTTLNELAGREAIGRRAAARAANLAKLQELFPSTFDERHPMPLALDVRKQIKAAGGRRRETQPRRHRVRSDQRGASAARDRAAATDAPISGAGRWPC
jgi:hypothetical protein